MSSVPVGKTVEIPALTKVNRYETKQSKLNPKSVRFLSIKPVLDQRPEVKEYLRRTSVVYATHGPLPLVVRTSLGHQVNHLRLRDLERHGWMRPIVSRGTRRNIQKSFSPSRGRREEPPESSDSSESETEDGCDTTRSLPPLGCNPLGQPMLRRPTIVWPGFERAKTDGDKLVEMMGNYLNLKPFTSDAGSTSDAGNSSAAFHWARDFYNIHYPLLLRKKFEDDHEKVVSFRHVAPRQTSLQKRKVDLNARIRHLERALTQLESDISGGVGALRPVFVTELRTDTFDPRVWPWNKELYQN